MSNTKIASQVVKKLLEGQSDMRFDLDCRVEVWITEDDIEMSRGYRDVIEDQSLDKGGKIAKLKELAVQLASEKLSSVEGVQITCDGPTMADINVDRVNWDNLVKTDAERESEYEYED